MIKHDRPTFLLEHARSSNSLLRFTSPISDAAVAVFDATSQGLTVTTFENGYGPVPDGLDQPYRHNAQTISVREIAVVEIASSEVNRLIKCANADKCRSWCAFDIFLQDGTRDLIALQLVATERLDLACDYLKRIWSLLRQDCLAEFQAANSDPIVEVDQFTESWGLLNRIDVAMLILTPKSQVAKVNVAARELLTDGNFLKRGNDGVFAALRDENCEFHRAVSNASKLKGQEDLVVCLTSKSGDKRIPVTLSRYYDQGRATNYVVAMLPTPPSSRQVERLVKQMGLTSSEARVAALMQLGLSNREAAEVSGLKPQTLNTYAKRILNKLNVSGRTEMAQLLTWQASGGRSA